MFDFRLSLDINNNWDTIIMPQSMLLHTNVHQLYAVVTEKRPFYMLGIDKIFIRFSLGRMDPVFDIKTDSGAVKQGDRYDVTIEYLRGDPNNPGVEPAVIWRRRYESTSALPAGNHRIDLDDDHWLPNSPIQAMSELVDGGVYDFRITATLREW
jgi:hypothetical protein